MKKDINNILIVCKGNICRSPFAEVVLRNHPRINPHIKIKSRATEDYHIGKGADSYAIIASHDFGYDLSKHIAKQISDEDLEWCDIILVMDEKNRQKLQTQFEKQLLSIDILCLGECLKPPQYNIPDPFRGPVNDFKFSFGLIKKACDCFVEKILLK